MSSKFLGDVSKIISDAWHESDRKAREEALIERLQNKLDAAEPCYCYLLDVVYEATRRHAPDLGVLAYGSPGQYRILDREDVMRHSDHIRFNNGRAYFAVSIRCRRLCHGECCVSLREFIEKFQAALDEVTTYWGYPDILVSSVRRVARPDGDYLGVILT